jgi:hypothetical protein
MNVFGQGMAEFVPSVAEGPVASSNGLRQGTASAVPKRAQHSGVLTPEVVRTCSRALLLATLISALSATPQSASAQLQSLTPARAAAVEDGVRAFTRTVAHDVTEEGPSAWRKHFADSPSFFMAVDGKLAFPSGAAMIAAIPDVARAIKHIELHWGDDLRVDPLTADLAVVGTSWHEVVTDAAGKRLETSGYFTGTVEHRDGRWQFRNAHWSSAAPASPAP